MWKSALLAASVTITVAACTTGPVARSVPQRTLAVPAPAPVTTAGVSVTLSDGQITSVRAYYSNSRSGNVRGRGRSGRLPPGIARNLARGKPLPPGIAMGYLPAAVVADLPRLPSGLDYVIVAGKLLLVEAATQVVREVLLDLAFDS